MSRLTWERSARSGRVFRAARGLAMALALAGCAAPESPRTLTLRVVNWAPDLELATDQRIADRFAARHPGVRVIVESVAENFGEKLATAIASGTPPDVFLLDVPDIPAFVDRGLTLDLAPYASRVGYQVGGVFPEVLSIFARGERLFAFPKDFTPMVVFVNRQVFRRLGVAPPPEDRWSWEEFLETARAVTRDLDGDGKTDVHAINFPRQLYEWMPWVWSAGGDILDPTGSRTVGYLDAPATVEVFGLLTSLVTRHRVAPPVQYLESGDASRAGRFYSGRQAMLLSGHWSLPPIRKHQARGRIEIGLASIPHRAGAEPATAIYVSGWAVPANVRHKRLAVELAAFLASEEAQRIRAESGLGIPALRAVALARAEADHTGVEAAFLRQVERGRMPWGAVVRDFHRIEQMSLDLMDRVLLRGEEPAAAAREVARAIDEAIAR